jgi:transcriptional antiterminator
MDKASNRRYQVIDMLSTHDKWFKSKEIAKKLNCTEKTILNDIQIINSTLPFDWQIDIKKGKGIYLKMPTHSTFNEIRSSFIKNFTINQALSFILIKEIKFISDLGKVLYMQHTSVYKLLSQIEEILKSYQLTLKRMPLFIEGSEFQKRILCCDLLDDLYSHTNSWLYESYTVSDLKNIVGSVSAKYELLLSPPTTYKIVYYIGTMIHRLKYKPLLSLHKEAIYQIKKSIFFSVSNEICDQIEKYYHMKISLEERLACSLFISLCPSYSHSNIGKSEVLNLYHYQKNTFYEELYVFVDMLGSELGFTLHMNNEFIISLQKQFKDLTLLVNSAEIKKPPSTVVQYVQTNYRELYKTVKLVLTNWTRKYSYFDPPNDVVARITLTIQASVLKQTLHKNRVLLLTSEGYGVQHYLMSRIEQEFSNKIQFVEFKQGRLTQENLISLNLDLIISDFQLDFEGFPITYIQSTLTQRDISQISQYIK